jgi:hypothetical protein
LALSRDETKIFPPGFAAARIHVDQLSCLR